MSGQRYLEGNVPELQLARSTSRARRRRWTAAGVTTALVAGVLSLAAVVSAPAHADTSSVSTFSKTGFNQTTPTAASADSTTGAHGAARSGDTIKWALNYANNTQTTANVTLNDNVTDGQTIVPNSLQLPPSWNGTAAGTSMTATGPVYPDTTTAQAPLFTVTSNNFTTQGGDGYSVEGDGNNVYTVFHHSAAATTVFCATLSGAVCPGWPAQATFVDPTPGTQLGTGTAGVYTTASVNGSFIDNGRLYWPVQTTAVPPSGVTTFGWQCLDLGSQTSCGFIQAGTTTLAGYSMDGDGIAAADGNHYYLDVNGFLNCISPAGTTCGSFDMGGGPTASGGNQEVGTYGRYVYMTFRNAASTIEYLGCFDTSTQAKCANYPVNVGAPNPPYDSEVMPVVDPSGTLLGACAVVQGGCFDPAGNAIGNPYSQQTYSFGGPAGPGFGTGVLVGTKYYTPNGNVDVCFDFALALVGGKVQPCAQFTTAPPNLRGYTVRALANLPGCMASNGDGAQITIFNAVTGGQCASASTSVTLSMNDYYCDGQGGHASTWDTVSLPGLTPADYLNASLTLFDVNGNPVPNWSNVLFPANSNSLDISSIPASGDTVKLTAQVNLVAITNPTAVAASSLEISWQGDPIQICFETVVPQVDCLVTVPVTNAAVAVSTAGVISDAPGGNPSGTAVFDVMQQDSACMIHFTKTATPSPAKAGDTVTYTIAAQNTGTANYLATSPATFSDDITDTLNDSVYQGDLAADAGTPAYDANTHVLSWSGPLAAGATATVTYSVKINDPDNGDHEMVNRVVSDNPSNCAADSTDPACTADVPVADLRVSKSADPASGSTVKAGDVITYTVTFNNVGKATADADYVDHLADVVDDADITTAPAASSTDLTVGAVADDAFPVTGTVPAETSYTVTYQVTIKPDGERGDNTAANFVTKAGEEPPAECRPGNAQCTVHYQSEIHDWKTVTPASGSPVVPGQVMTYTLHFTNKGTGPGAVDKVDDISQAVDDAALLTQPTSSDPALTATAFGTSNRTHITGTLAAGQTVTVTYQLKVRADGELGDQILANFLLLPDDPAPTSPDCVPADTDEPDCTANPVGDLKVAKSVDPKDGSAVNPGQTLTYTLKFDNVGKGVVNVHFTDHLAKVLDDATVTSAPESSDGALTVSPISNRVFRINGSLDPGQAVEVTYQVKVNDYDAQGDHNLDNFLVPTGNPAPKSCVGGDPMCTHNPSLGAGAQSAGGGTAVTGGNWQLELLAGGLLLAAGALLLLLGMRRRTS
jgi:fimbrial isopeptide formation D2 family protein/uncharacterized repeat protein (TIGR01451 family)